jgi:hypothetical protein
MAEEKHGRAMFSAVVFCSSIYYVDAIKLDPLKPNVLENNRIESANEGQRRAGYAR